MLLLLLGLDIQMMKVEEQTAPEIRLSRPIRPHNHLLPPPIQRWKPLQHQTTVGVVAFILEGKLDGNSAQKDGLVQRQMRQERLPPKNNTRQRMFILFQRPWHAYDQRLARW